MAGHAMVKTGQTTPQWAVDVLAFWFSELEPKHWFKKSDATDQLIRDRFTEIYDQVASLPVDDAMSTAETALAAIIVLDQFSRNMFRNSAKAFATDAKGLEIARRMRSAGFDREIDRPHRVFVYLPFEHSEDLEDQNKSVEYISELANEDLNSYAEAHRDVIRRFGRFPHRNTILGRASSQAELDYLAQPGSGF